MSLIEIISMSLLFWLAEFIFLPILEIKIEKYTNEKKKKKNKKKKKKKKKKSPKYSFDLI